MTQTIEERIREMLKHTVVGVRGYPIKEIRLLTDWEDKNVYGFHLGVDEPVQIGVPWFYLVKGDEITVSNIDQSIDIMAKIYDETHRPEDEVYGESWEDDEEQESVPEPVPCMISCAGPRI